MKDRKVFNLTIMFGLLLILSAGLVALVQAMPAQAASAVLAGEMAGTSGGAQRIPVAPADLPARPGLVVPPSLPPAGPLLQTPVLTITKRADLDPVNAGGMLVYTIVVRNSGDTAAPGTIITDGLDARVSFVSASDGGMPSSGVVTWSPVSVPPGQTITRSLQVKVGSNVPSGASLSNTANVTSTQGTHDSYTLGTQVQTSADLSITKTDSDDPVVAGTSFSYNLSVTNNGPSDASGVSVSDQLPAGLSFNPSGSSGECSVANGLVTCTVGNLSANGTINLTIAVDVAPSAPGALSNTASVLGSQPDPVSSNNSSTQTTTINRQADLSITKTDSADPVVAGSSFSYNLSVRNNGPSDASGVTITDNLPTGLTFSPGSGCLAAGQQVTCNIGSLSANTTVNRTIVVNVGAGLADGTVLTNGANVLGTEPDPNGGNNLTTETTTVNRPADLSITKSDSSDPVAAGSLFSYNLSVTNHGPFSASGVTITDNLPTGLTFSSGSGCSAAGQQVTCNIASLSANTTVNRTIVVNVSAGLADGTHLNNTASVSSSQPDPSPGNNSSTQTTTIIRRTDLSITKSDSSDPVVVGSWFSYNLSIRNNGPSDASGVTVSDTLPTGLTFRSSDSSGGCSAAGQQVTCTGGGLPANSTGNFTIAVNVSAGLADGTQLNNTASVSGSQIDPVSGNNSATETTTFIRRTDLQITKSDSSDPVVAGSWFRYNLSIRNNGPSNASGVRVSDTLPAGLTFRPSDSSGECTAVGQEITCIVGNLPVSSPSSLRVIAVDVAAWLAEGSLSNTASVEGDQTDPNGSNDSGSQSTSIIRRPDLEVTLSDSSDPVGIGGSFTYHVTVTNHGPSNASGVTVSDTLPTGLSFRQSGSSSECSAVSQHVTCDAGDLAAGHNVALAVAVDVDDSLADGTLLSNTVVVSANETDPNGGNDSATEGTLSKVLKVYLPVLIRSLTELSVFNDNTGGDVTFTVVGAGVSCVVPNNATQFCGSFEPGTYTVRVSSLCGDAEAVKTYESGPVITRIYCK